MKHLPTLLPLRCFSRRIVHHNCLPQFVWYQVLRVLMCGLIKGGYDDALERLCSRHLFGNVIPDLPSMNALLAAMIWIVVEEGNQQANLFVGSIDFSFEVHALQLHIAPLQCYFSFLNRGPEGRELPCVVGVKKTLNCFFREVLQPVFLWVSVPVIVNLVLLPSIFNQEKLGLDVIIRAKLQSLAHLQCALRLLHNGKSNLLLQLVYVRSEGTNSTKLHSEVMYVLHLHHDETDTTCVSFPEILPEWEWLLLSLIACNAIVDGGPTIVQQPLPKLLLLPCLPRFPWEFDRCHV
mmetsp:Transcript_93546/g.166423  ORF Transcript_93546/g.166423 Transcript_93546/m.166423 type:complete len:293 (+) Transcript_93546:150-1028(+)